MLIENSILQSAWGSTPSPVTPTSMVLNAIHNSNLLQCPPVDGSCFRPFSCCHQKIPWEVSLRSKATSRHCNNIFHL